jgi:hypothetical protein
MDILCCLHVQTAVIAATAAAVGLLGLIIAKKRSGQSDEDIKADLKRSVRKSRVAPLLAAVHMPKQDASLPRLAVNSVSRCCALASTATMCSMPGSLMQSHVVQGREASKAAGKAARKGSEVAQEKGADLWGFTKAKAQEVRTTSPTPFAQSLQSISAAACSP